VKEKEILFREGQEKLCVCMTGKRYCFKRNKRKKGEEG
jgi:hypothetical protein